MFPIVSEPVWSMPHAEGENEGLTKMRNKWTTATRRMPRPAVAVLERLQPTDRSHEPYFHCLDLLNRLSNKDRHRMLLIHLTGLVSISVWYVTDTNAVYTVTAEPDVPKGTPRNCRPGERGDDSVAARGVLGLNRERNYPGQDDTGDQHGERWSPGNNPRRPSTDSRLDQKRGSDPTRSSDLRSVEENSEHGRKGSPRPGSSARLGQLPTVINLHTGRASVG